MDVIVGILVLCLMFWGMSGCIMDNVHEQDIERLGSATAQLMECAGGEHKYKYIQSRMIDGVWSDYAECLCGKPRVEKHEDCPSCLRDFSQKEAE